MSTSCLVRRAFSAATGKMFLSFTLFIFFNYFIKRLPTGFSIMLVQAVYDLQVNGPNKVEYVMVLSFMELHLRMT